MQLKIDEAFAEKVIPADDSVRLLDEIVEGIESALYDFEGTMLFVSHDRYFLNKFANRVWSMDDGVITRYECGFEEYLEM